MKYLPESIERLIEELRTLPGVGQKTAERLAFWLLKNPDQNRLNLGEAILKAKEGVGFCENCFHFADDQLCSICSDSNREKDVICVVEDQLDLIAIEKTGVYRGLFHVLGGLISPLDGIGPSKLKIAELEQRVVSRNFSEIIIALNPTLEGEATSVHIQQRLKMYPVKITRPARGLPVGGDLEYTDENTLKKAFESRIGF